jgi:hypothetical protein
MDLPGIVHNYSPRSDLKDWTDPASQAHKTLISHYTMPKVVETCQKFLRVMTKVADGRLKELMLMPYVAESALPAWLFVPPDY